MDQRRVRRSVLPRWPRVPRRGRGLLQRGRACDAAQFLDLAGRYRVTRSQVVPTMFSRLLKLPEPVREAADISSLEVIINAPASRAWCQRAPREAG